LKSHNVGIRKWGQKKGGRKGKGASISFLGRSAGVSKAGIVEGSGMEGLSPTLFTSFDSGGGWGSTSASSGKKKRKGKKGTRTFSRETTTKKEMGGRRSGETVQVRLTRTPQGKNKQGKPMKEGRVKRAVARKRNKTTFNRNKDLLQSPKGRLNQGYPEKKRNKTNVVIE